MKGTPSIIVTLSMDNHSQTFFDKLRTAHFPAHINYLQAHITLFHHLPAGNDQVMSTISRHADRQSFPMLVRDIRHTGNGNAYRLESAILQQMHKSMQQALASWLIPQDRQTLRPHITIQNKVTAYKAMMLHRQLSEEFVPFEITATGISIWLYQNGPWQNLMHLYFK